ncbi:MAG: class I SAM-dependent methyltransferase [Planctomycetota bacterium]|jgi:SAM-dependent methyltransferase
MSGLDDQEQGKVDEVWGKFAEGSRSGQFFLEIGYVHDVYMRRHYPPGKILLDTVREVQEARGHSFSRVLVLGCGDGALERTIAKRGLAQDILGLDVSKRAIGHARKQAHKDGYPGIQYSTADLNCPPDGLGTFDLVFAPSSIHHIRELEVLFDWVAGIVPKGLLVLQEYVGPSRFQWPQKQREIAQGVLSLIPEFYRRLPDGTHKESIWAPTAEDVAGGDPTEAVRSAEILPLLEERFEVVRRLDHGGAVAMPVLHDIARNFHHENHESLVLLQFILHIDDLLLREGVLDTNFSDVIVRPG